jgi:hypothetical protein
MPQAKVVCKLTNDNERKKLDEVFGLSGSENGHCLPWKILTISLRHGICTNC